MSKLAVVQPTDEPASLSPSREKLARRIKERVEAGEALAEAVRQQQRVEKLIPDKTPILNRIAELERSQSEEIERWAIDGTSETPPQLPHALEIEQLKKQLKEAEAIEPGARAAAARMIEEIQACQEDSRRAVEAIHSATDSVIYDHAAQLVEELRELDRQAALKRAALTACAEYFLREGRTRPVGNIASTISREIPQSLELAPQSINQIVGKWAAFSSRLFVDPNAALEL